MCVKHRPVGRTQRGQMEEGPLQKAEGQTEEEAVHVKGALTQRWKRLPLLRIQ